MALRAMYLTKIDMGFFTEAKLTDDKYTKHFYGYETFASTSVKHCKGGILLFWKKKSTTWNVASSKDHGPNVISCVLISVYRKCLVIGGYISPNETNEETCNYIEEETRRYNIPTIICGDFNFNKDSNETRDIAIATTFANCGVNISENISNHQENFTMETHGKVMMEEYLEVVTIYLHQILNTGKHKIT